MKIARLHPRDDHGGDLRHEPRQAFMVDLHVWVDVDTEEAAIAAVNRMVEASRECNNNGTVDIDRVVSWDYNG